MKKILDVQALDAGYGDISVLRGVSLHAYPSEIISIVGANSIIARCEYINAWGKFKISHKIDKICAINLLEGK